MKWKELVVYIALLSTFGVGVSFVWGAATQLDLMVVEPFMEWYDPDDTWCFPFFGGWFSIYWPVYDAYVRMFWGIGIGVVILTFGMFVLGYILGKFFTMKRLRREVNK